MTSFLINAAKYYAAQPPQNSARECIWESLNPYTQSGYTKCHSASTEPPVSPLTADGRIPCEALDHHTVTAKSL